MLPDVLWGSHYLTRRRDLAIGLDGKIWVTEVSRAVRIRTAETGEDAL